MYVVKLSIHSSQTLFVHFVKCTVNKYEVIFDEIEIFGTTDNLRNLQL